MHCVVLGAPASLILRGSRLPAGMPALVRLRAHYPVPAKGELLTINHVKWLDIENGRWQSETIVEGGRRVRLKTPGQGHWAAVLVAEPEQ